jgi:hypothetical protein
MTKVEVQAVVVCVLLSLAVVIGSTGFGYADYRPLRNYDIFALTISWVGFVFYLWRGRKAA